MSDYLPEEILINILSRLPVKTLLQFRCVSRTWHSLISSPAFIAHHLNKSTVRNTDLLFFKIESNVALRSRYFLYPDKDFPNCNGHQVIDFLELQKFDYNQPHCLARTHLEGSSNGLFFIYQLYFECNKSKYFCRAALWNPSIRKIVPIPTPTDTLESRPYFDSYFGFGFDSINHDYKSVRICYMNRQVIRHFHLVTELPPLVEVYSMKSGGWRMVDSDLKCFIQKFSTSAFVNGACHWTANTEEWGGGLNVVVFFNLADEKIGEMPVPDNFVIFNIDHVSLTVTVFDGLLALVALSKRYNDEPISSIWAMKNYGDSQSWTKLFNIELPELGFISGFVGFKKNGEMFLAEEDTGLISYPATKNECFRIGGTKSSGFTGRFYLYSYMESLVLLNETNSASKERKAPKELSSYGSNADMMKGTKKKTRKCMLNFSFLSL